MTTKQTPNTDLAVEVLNNINFNPASWYQGSWRCNSGMCFGGWTAELAGGRWIQLATDDMSSYLYFDPTIDNELDWDWIPLLDRDGEEIEGQSVRGVSAARRAAKLLGISEDSAAALFGGSNTYNDLEQYVAAMKDGKKLEEVDLDREPEREDHEDAEDEQVEV